METNVVGQFRMKGCGEQMPLLRRDDPAIGQTGENFRIRLNRFNDRSTDEDGVIRTAFAQFGDGQVGFKGVHLAAEGIALDGDIHEAQQWLVAAGIL